MSWANQSYTTKTTVTTTSSAQQQMQHGSQGNQYFQYDIPVQYNQVDLPIGTSMITHSPKQQEFSADTKVQRLANAASKGGRNLMRKEVEMMQGPFREYIAESYRVTPDQTYHIKVRVAPGKTIDLVVYSSE